MTTEGIERSDLNYNNFYHFCNNKIDSKSTWVPTCYVQDTMLINYVKRKKIQFLLSVKY